MLSLAVTRNICLSYSYHKCDTEIIMIGRFVSYLRASTKRQGRSGLGEEARRKAITDYLNGGHWELVEEFVEVESGKHHENRPQIII